MSRHAEVRRRPLAAHLGGACGNRRYANARDGRAARPSLYRRGSLARVQSTRDVGNFCPLPCTSLISIPECRRVRRPCPLRLPPSPSGDEAHPRTGHSATVLSPTASAQRTPTSQAPVFYQSPRLRSGQRGTASATSPDPVSTRIWIVGLHCSVANPSSPRGRDGGYDVIDFTRRPRFGTNAGSLRSRRTTSPRPARRPRPVPALATRSIFSAIESGRNSTALLHLAAASLRPARRDATRFSSYAPRANTTKNILRPAGSQLRLANPDPTLRGAAVAPGRCRAARAANHLVWMVGIDGSASTAASLVRTTRTGRRRSRSGASSTPGSTRSTRTAC